MERILYAIFLIALLLTVSCDDGIIKPEAGPLPAGSFISQVDVKDPFKVSFSASAQNAANIFWDFGDGKGVANGPTVTYTYGRSGNYTVILTLINKAGIYDVKKELAISGIETPVADFSFEIDDANAPLTVHFQNESEFGATYLWEFDDGNTSTLGNPTHTYTSTGKYSVRLTATSVDGEKRNSKRREFFVINSADLAGLSSKPWRFATTVPPSPSAYYVTNAEGDVVINSALESCELNDRYVFSLDKTYSCENQGDARLRINNYACGAFAQPPGQTWALVRNDDLNFSLTIGLSYIGDPAGSASYKIVNLSPSQLQLQFQRDAAGGAKETVHMAFEPE
jgi:hypothetical protein